VQQGSDVKLDWLDTDSGRRDDLLCKPL
jgi:hypothetical protein